MIHHDNAKEFLYGKFASVCRENNIIQTQSAPYSPNQNPAERYMEIIVIEWGTLTTVHLWTPCLHFLVSFCLSPSLYPKHSSLTWEM